MASFQDELNKLLNASLGPGGSFGNTPTAAPSAQLKFTAPKQTNTTSKPTTTQKTTTPSSGGNNSGNSGGGSSAPAAPSFYFDPSTGQKFGSYGDFLSEINNAFGGASDILNQQESSIRAGEQDLYKQATAPYESQIPLLEQAKTENLTRNTSQANSEKQTAFNAIDAARNLANELRQGAQQRFGGSSSAGEFAYNLLGREQQRQFGNIQNTLGQNLSKLSEQANSIVSGFQSELQKLNVQKEGAIAAARDEFRRRLDQINSARFELEQNKAQAKLQELYNLRARAQQIEDQYRQFTMNLQTQAQQAFMNTQQALQQYQAQTGQQVQTNAYANPAYPQFGGGAVNPASDGFLSGYYQKFGKKPTDLGFYPG